MIFCLLLLLTPYILFMHSASVHCTYLTFIVLAHIPPFNRWGDEWRWLTNDHPWLFVPWAMLLVGNKRQVASCWVASRQQEQDNQSWVVAPRRLHFISSHSSFASRQHASFFLMRNYSTNWQDEDSRAMHDKHGMEGTIHTQRRATDRYCPITTVCPSRHGPSWMGCLGNKNPNQTSTVRNLAWSMIQG